jgi:SecD/SecF fusion protein
VVELKVDGLDDPEGAVNQAMNVLRKRVDRFGVAEPVIQSAGNNKIIIQIPGISQSKREEAKRNIQRVASLRFQLVNENVEYQPGIIVPGSTNLTDKFTTDDGKQVERQVMVETKVQMGGERVTRAVAARDPLSGAPVINFALDATGAGIFQDVTSRNIGRGLAIVLVDLKEDGSEQQELISAPTIQSAIGARGEITGIDTHGEAREIANVLENPLSTPLKIIEERDVDPSLGADSVNKGFEAAQWGIIAVAVFMLGYYLLCGLFANVALALNIVILLGVFCYFGSTLTLPGIAGIVLTIGMAVDANVLIFERIREEHRAGKSLKGAVASGYGKAFGTIFDANITTVIASLILYWKGHGPVQGFGITLTIGILTSMFTALVVTRLLFDILIDNKWLKSHPKMFAFVGDTKIDFLKYAKPAFIASWVVIIVGIGGALMRGTDSMLGIDFAGGRSLVIKYDEAKKTEVRGKIPEIRKHLADKIEGIELSQVNVRLQSAMSTGDEFMRVDFPDVERSEGEVAIEQEVDEQLRAGFDDIAVFARDKDGKPVRSSSEKVGASISSEIQTAAIVATILAMFGILIYVAFRYEFSFAIGAVLAIVHDVLMTAGLFFLAGMVTGIDIASGELNAPVIAAFLTIIGFSINDTIVIFDRIREALTTGVRGSFANVMNVALNQTLARTIITSGTTLLSTATLYFFGGVVIHDFAFCLLVGVIVGTYSSIYIACAIVLWKHKGKRPELTVGDIEITPDPVSA